MRVLDGPTVVVLAGGISRRFGGDKLLAPLNSRVVLAHVVDQVSPLASEIIVATSTASREAELAPQLPESTRFLYDRPARWGKGPAATMASAREALGEGPILFVPGDVPWIETPALRRFVSAAARSQAEVAVPVWGSGETEHLLQWQRDGSLLSHLPWTPESSVPSSWRASEFVRAVPRTLLVPVIALTSVPGSFSHVTYPSDLHDRTFRGRFGNSRVNQMVQGVPKRAYRLAHRAQRMGDLSRAAGAFAAESQWYERSGLKLLARHAREDSDVTSGEAILEARSNERVESPTAPVISRSVRVEFDR